MIFLCPQENAGMFPKSQGCYYMPLTQPSSFRLRENRPISMKATKFSFQIMNFAINQDIKIPQLV